MPSRKTRTILVVVCLAHIHPHTHIHKQLVNINGEPASSSQPGQGEEEEEEIRETKTLSEILEKLQSNRQNGQDRHGEQSFEQNKKLIQAIKGIYRKPIQFYSVLQLVTAPGSKKGREVVGESKLLQWRGE